MAINTNILKAYAPEARRAFIAAVKARAARFGITEQGISVIREEGNVAIINGQPYPRSFAQQRRDLDRKIGIRGYAAVMEEVAYTWFNRFAAIRYMELHDYLDHGIRVLSHPNGGSTPEIVEKAAQVDLPGLKRDQVVALKLDGTKDEELYRLLIVAQCNALHAVMPFLFEKIEDETELLLPDNLLHSESLVRQLVERIPEGDWQQIEIIGWLYQFYISEKKEQVIGKVVKSEDIPAATQLFTPNWIVKYMVQNSLGSKWLATYPNSSLRAKMEYFIDLDPQSPDIVAQIEATTPSTLDPESITFLDPASGSGHILVEAYDLFREIYLERGYRLREIPRLILEKNIYGLDIDDRAAQLSGFALMMRARADDRQILSSESPARLNILAIQESNGVDAQEIQRILSRTAGHQVFDQQDLLPDTLAQPVLSAAKAATSQELLEILSTFQSAKTFGSLLQPDPRLVQSLVTLQARDDEPGAKTLLEHGDNAFRQPLQTFVRQAEFLARRYDVVVANPPYMGTGGMNPQLKAFAASRYPNSKHDLYSMFIERAARASSWSCLVTMHSWMFTSRFERFRDYIFQTGSLASILHLGSRAFPEVSGEVVKAAIVALRPGAGAATTFIDVTDGNSGSKSDAVKNKAYERYDLPRSIFDRFPGKVLAYWATPQEREIIVGQPSLGTELEVREGMATADNERFIRHWFEVSLDRICLRYSPSTAGGKPAGRWFPYQKGGTYRKWFGNNELVVDWENDGHAIRNLRDPATGRVRSHNYNGEFSFRPGVTWTAVSSGNFGARTVESGSLFDSKGTMGFPKDGYPEFFVGLLNSVVGRRFIEMFSPTLDFRVGHILAVPLPVHMPADRQLDAVRRAIETRQDWDSYENSWDFQSNELIVYRDSKDLAEAYKLLRASHDQRIGRVQKAEAENDASFCSAYGLAVSELRSSTSIAEITLTCNPSYRYGSEDSSGDKSHERSVCADIVLDFVSYAVGCTFGRYSLDQPGLVLANQGETLQDYLNRVPTPSFLPDADNIIPVLEDPWFSDDLSDRFLEFLRVAFGEEKYGENLAFVEAALGKDVRKFFKRDFYADHLRRYKKRPIYWLFSSGKERAFEALVYLHRYNEGTLARMRLEYVVPLQTQMAGRVQRLTEELRPGNLSSSETKKRNVQLEKLQKQQDELRRFEEELHHFADQRIKLDLDDGVKANYGKFGNLLADVKTITGGKDEE